MPEYKQALFALGSGRDEPEWAEEWAEGSGSMEAASVVGREAGSCV